MLTLNSCAQNTGKKDKQREKSAKFLEEYSFDFKLSFVNTKNKNYKSQIS